MSRGRTTERGIGLMKPEDPTTGRTIVKRHRSVQRIKTATRPRTLILPGLATGAFRSCHRLRRHRGEGAASATAETEAAVAQVPVVAPRPDLMLPRRGCRRRTSQGETVETGGDRAGLPEDEIEIAEDPTPRIASLALEEMTTMIGEVPEEARALAAGAEDPGTTKGVEVSAGRTVEERIGVAEEVEAEITTDVAQDGEGDSLDGSYLSHRCGLGYDPEN